MIHRKTSVEAYREIKTGGLLSKRRFEVYECLFYNGPMTASEISEMLPGKKSRTIGSNVHARLGELRESGVVYEVKERICSISGKNVIEWDVTDKLPAPIQKKKDVFACKQHMLFVNGDRKQCDFGATALFPCEIRRVVFK